MRIRRFALVLTVLTLVLMPRVGQSQGTQPARKKPPSLGQNFPNPFNPETRFPFNVDEYPTCPGGRGQHRVTVKIYNILAQLVAVPQLEGGSGGVAGGQKVENLPLPCGQYTAFWNGKYSGTSREVASGIYIAAIEIDGKRDGTIRITVAK